tara:strand:- start:433 stop:633 length:201 start_codon:yes stop_codon:yes gene_type:complete
MEAYKEKQTAAAAGGAASSSSLAEIEEPWTLGVVAQVCPLPHAESESEAESDDVLSYTIHTDDEQE